MGKKKGGNKKKKGGRNPGASTSAPDSALSTALVQEPPLQELPQEAAEENPNPERAKRNKKADELAGAIVDERIPGADTERSIPEAPSNESIVPEAIVAKPLLEATPISQIDSNTEIPALSMSEAAIARPWKRFAAALYDLILMIFIYALTITVVIGRMFYEFSKPLPEYDPAVPALGPTKQILTTTIICLVAFTWLYFTLLDSRPFKGTIGKLLFSLRVSDWERRPLGFIQANLRLLSKLLMFATLGIGFLWAVFRKNRQGLHDRMSKSLVLDMAKKKPN